VRIESLSTTLAEITMSNNGQMPKDMQRIEELVQQIEATADPNFRAMAVELVQLLMELHGSGIARMLKIVSQTGAAGTDIVKRFSQDDLVGQLLMLYDLHPVDLETRIKQALDKVRPMLKSHGGDVELLSVEDGLVRLRLNGSCNGCPSSSLTLKNAIEEAIYEAAADIAGLEVVGVVDQPPSSGFVPLKIIKLG
jgi:Fe-S cluster biogenesis protein NfuA